MTKGLSGKRSNDLSFGQLFLLEEIRAREAAGDRVRRKKLLRHPEFPAAALLGLALGFTLSILFLSLQSNGLAAAGQAAAAIHIQSDLSQQHASAMPLTRP